MVFRHIILFITNLFDTIKEIIEATNTFHRFRYIIIDTVEIPDETDDVPPLINMEYNNGRKCGYCRQNGHTVRFCNDPDIIIYRNEVDLLINYYSDNEEINEWIEEKDTQLLKAIFCYSGILSFTRHYYRNDIERRILNYITEQQVLHNITENMATGSNLSMTIHHRYPTFITYNELYKQLSIDIIKTNLAKQPIDCPICLENTNNKIIQTTNCNHDFCRICMTKQLKNAVYRFITPNCPLCRNEILTLTNIATFQTALEST
jgi:hypothetical protein